MKPILLIAACATLAACVSTPVNIIDSKTALEQQAAGSYPELARELEEAAVQPGPVPLTREQLTASGGNATPAATEAGEPTDAARIEALLTRKCIGEGSDGRLTVTKATCAGDPDEQEVASLTERQNRARQQTWTYLQTLYPNQKPADVRAAWRTTRLRELICGAQVQGTDGAWGSKKC